MVPWPVVVFSMLKMGWLKFLMFAPVVILKGWVQLEWNHLLYFLVLVESISWILRGTYLQTYLRYLDHGFRLNRSPRVPSCGTNITTSPKTTHLMCMFFPATSLKVVRESSWYLRHLDLVSQCEDGWYQHPWMETSWYQQVIRCFLGTLYITYLDRWIDVVKGVCFWLQYSDMLISNCLCGCSWWFLLSSMYFDWQFLILYPLCSTYFPGHLLHCIFTASYCHITLPSGFAQYRWGFLYNSYCAILSPWFTFASIPQAWRGSGRGGEWWTWVRFFNVKCVVVFQMILFVHGVNGVALFFMNSE